MLIRTGFEMIFSATTPVPMILLLSPRPELDGQVRRPGGVRVEPSVPVEAYLDGYGNRCHRFLAPAGRVRIWDDLVVEHDGSPDPVAYYATQAPVNDLPADVLVYLMASRYCEVDGLVGPAWELFGNTAEGWPRVQAVCDWVHHNVTFGYQFARPTKTALDVYKEKTGVCRDFNHLALTFCRCLNIPARYATGYLGDIGVPPNPSPMDFHGWFEAYLDGQWYAFDARHNVPRIGRLLMAHGRDAVDAALTTAFGANTLEKFVVWTDEVGPEALDAPPGVIETGTWRTVSEV